MKPVTNSIKKSKLLDSTIKADKTSNQNLFQHSREKDKQSKKISK